MGTERLMNAKEKLDKFGFRAIPKHFDDNLNDEQDIFRRSELSRGQLQCAATSSTPAVTARDRRTLAVHCSLAFSCDAVVVAASAPGPFDRDGFLRKFDPGRRPVPVRAVTTCSLLPSWNIPSPLSLAMTPKSSVACRRV